MAIDRVVVNASPLIALMGIGQEGLLPGLFKEVIVPAGVMGEIALGIDKDPNATRLPQLQWVCQVSVKDVPQSILAWDLGRGESEVLAHAKAVEDCTAVLDDRAARHCARAVGVRVLGTGKILVLAKQRGLIPSVKAQIEHLTAAEFRLSDALIQKLLAEAGEGG